ncbi:single-stranded-DNA-specific exonuclease RecJ [Alloyangia pacifica]|uniref:Single-stranded-DNA-specific exonuclease RecJ n=1 Tax=Alloyangia pacifica TaxID=311180 RepID=A0A2U8HDT8_9RHOB|nr:single-stranded-DNA-specific exonuclease RecJ [Alloyangia pacifica]AWI83953.1 single-stranded-DNA-specific exonuclease RecJ [Alloyangia pacifica]
MSYLGVEQSLTGRRWVGPAVEVERQAEALAQATHLPRPLCAVLARLGVPGEEVPGFLDPKLRDLMPDPRVMRDMEKASGRILQAVRSRERIAIFADYDVDGGSSAALLIDWLRQLGLEATLYVPDRIDEGYGPNVPAMQQLASAHDLIICVDCGTLSHDPIAAASGADVVVLDHHLGGETLPDCVAVVNPNRQDEDGALAHLCAAAVVFMVLVDCGRQIREAGAKGPDLMSLLDLVALATVADVAPLRGVNRAFVRSGLQVMARRARPGLVALSDVARLDTAPSSYHLGYVLGPRINAGGRIGQADLGARLLATRDRHEAEALAERLDKLNSERREVEEAVRASAIAQAEDRGLDAPLVWAAGEGWHPGVVGIVASRLKEMTNRPSVVIGFEGGEGKGSGRSVSGVDLGASIQKLAAEGLLIKGGGHKMAAGLTVAEDKLEPAMARLAELLAKQGAGQGGAADLRLDGLMMPGVASTDLCDRLEQAGPFGAGAPGPRFAMPDAQILFAKEVGTGHLKITAGDGLGAKIDAICFGAFDTPMGQALSQHKGGRFHLAGRFEINEWNGRRSVQMRLEDAAPAAG